ncbi:MAG: hypothetical protein DI598_12810 [Pseudopedobacter saltans]|uniref:Signal transduction histidine kinase internal region domain-containing protein n=1 Tax=Pseudopedobacter saltans TaxID=151895 RepID=A0A2W5EW94_9SPHI|nr:MAG: hypothetical protein DI598_12810 [Pseudopedobacter saltans]
MLTPKAIGQQLISILFFTFFFFITTNTYYYAGILKKKTKHYLFYGLVFLLLFIAYSLLTNIIYPDYTEKSKKIFGEKSLLFFTILGILIWVVMILLIVVYALSTAKTKDEKSRNQKLLERNSQLEIEKLRAEYNFLKAQINPHFMHNSLNFLYSKSLPYSPELSEGLLTISEIMRYALMNDANSDGLVLLSKEVEHIRNIIKMNQLRFENQLNIVFGIKGNINGVRVVPLVLITILENAFKHGDIRSTNYPLSISLVIDDNISFSCFNKKKIGPKELSFGIGINNTKQRLEMLYQGNAKLEIKDGTETYLITLQLPLKK